jgi:hypothetical protein
MKHTFGFVIVMEQGDLEAKTALLVESIRRQPALAACPVFVVQPRSGPPPAPATLATLAKHDAHFVYADLNRSWRRHGPMNKVYAAALVESFVEQTVETLVFLDSDVVVVTPPDGLALTGAEVAAAAPIAQWQVGKAGQLVGELLNPYWAMIYEVCGVRELPDWHVTTTIDRRRMLPYFNSGVVAVRPAYGIFRKWLENVERAAQDKRARQLSTDSLEFFFFDQTMLAGTLVAELTREQVRVLEHRYNYPLPAHHLLPDGVRVRRLEDVSIVHYHAAFSNLYWMDEIEIAEPLASWLRGKLPLRPRLRLTRAASLLLTSHLLSRLPLRRRHHAWVRYIPGIRKTLLAR